jgi:hypothetical protein
LDRCIDDYLGIEVWREDGKSLITQFKYENELIKNFNMNEYKPMSNPLKENGNLCVDDDTK